jgi:hypothetical protein
MIDREFLNPRLDILQNYGDGRPARVVMRIRFLDFAHTAVSTLMRNPFNRRSWRGIRMVIWLAAYMWGNPRFWRRN